MNVRYLIPSRKEGLLLVENTKPLFKQKQKNLYPSTPRSLLAPEIFLHISQKM